MPAISAAGTPDDGVDYERLAGVLILWVLGLLWLWPGLWSRRTRRRLQERGVQVSAFTTGRCSAASDYNTASYEVWFTAPSGVPMTMRTGNPASPQLLVYDPEQPPVIKRLGPFRYLHHRPWPVLSLGSRWRRFFEWSSIIIGLLMFALGVGGLFGTTRPSPSGEPGLALAITRPYTASRLHPDAEAAIREQFDTLFEVGGVVQVRRDQQRLRHVVLANPLRQGIEITGERRDINGTAVYFAPKDTAAVVRLRGQVVFMFGIDAASTRGIVKAVVTANP